MTGIYKITNTFNGKVYIGQSKDIEQRIEQHLSALKHNKHENKTMQKEYNLFSSAFIFEVLEECPLSLLNEAEKRWIAYYTSDNPYHGYNQNKGGGYKKRKNKGRPTCLLDDLTN